MASRRVVGYAFALVACVSCAAIAGLEEPSDFFDASEGGPDAPGGGDGPNADAPPAAPIGNGSGRDGPYVITDKRPVNDYAPLAKAAGVGARSVTLGRRDPGIATQPFKAGDVLLIVQVATPGANAAYDASPLDSEVGTWELASATAVNGDVVDLSASLTHAFSVPGTQVVRVAQATTVEIASAGGITAPKWDGLTGGIVAILSTEGIVVNGSIDVGGLGFRGPNAVKVAYLDACQATEGLVDAGFARRGEGHVTIDGGFNGLTGGRGNAGNGGGGGDCHNAGGGGGGNGGRGGVGGIAYDGDCPVGGIGGAALRRPPGVALLRFGGAGGAGEANDEGIGYGGSGGGIIFVRAPKLTGVGTIGARGNGGGGSNQDGAGGGGAGGTVYLDIEQQLVCGRLSITGGSGGNCVDNSGPGGGGGGGLAFIRDAAADACLIEVLSGQAGRSSNTARGAGPPDNERDAATYAGVVSNDLTP